MKTTGSLTGRLVLTIVLFEDPFWIGLFEIIDQKGLRACKVTFGAKTALKGRTRGRKTTSVRFASGQEERKA